MSNDESRMLNILPVVFTQSTTELFKTFRVLKILKKKAWRRVKFILHHGRISKFKIFLSGRNVFLL